MSRIKNIFNNLKIKNQKAFIPFITAGDGGLDLSLEIMHNLVKSGADIIELGVPFSDPMADGPIIAASHERAVKKHISLKDVLSLVKKFRQTNNTTAVILMGYLNPIEVFGYKKFASEANKSGVDGVLVVDMPPEEATELKDNLDKKDIDVIFLIAPTTTDKRIQFLANIASGFVYFVSLKGVTGSADLDVDMVSANLSRIRKFIHLPVGVGFGIKDGKTAQIIAKNADGVIVGSSLVKFIEKYSQDKIKMLDSINDLAQQIAGAIK